MNDKRIPCRYMFSNGTEYEIFLETQCYKCSRFRNGRCKTFYAIEKARWVGEKAFPFDDLLDWEHFGGKTCKRFIDEPIRRKKPCFRKPLKNQMKLEET